MHDGVFHSLPEVLDFYSRSRVASGKSAISEDEKQSLLALFAAFSDFEAEEPPSPVCPNLLKD
jgi:cytochrome c peroxidase